MKRFSIFGISVMAAGFWVTADSGLAGGGATHLTIQSHIGSTEHGSRVMSRTYDDSGMSGDSGSAGATNDTHSTDVSNHMGLLNGDTPPLFIEYDLGQSYALTNLVIWNDNEPTWYKQGMKGAMIEIRNFGGSPTVVFSNDIPFAPAQGGGPTTASIDIDLSGMTGRFVRFTTDPLPNSSWRFFFDGTTNDVACSLSEVRIYGDPAGLGNGTTEACCFPDGSCSNMVPLDCSNAGGVPEGPSTECFSTVCPQVQEACCFPDGTCDDLDPNVCIASNGVPQGASSTCALAVCPQPEACCLPDGTCDDLLTNLCVAAGGTPQGIFTTCAGTTCPQPEACCLPAAPWCMEMTPSACVTAGGTPGGSGTLCATHDCSGSIEITANNALEMDVVTYENLRYDLERATDMVADNWTDLPTYLIGDGTVVTQQLVGDDNADPDAYYRWAGFQRPNPCGIAAAIGSPSASNGWDTTSAVSVRASREKAGRPFVNTINGTGISADGCTHTDCLEDDCLSDGSTFNTMGFNEGPTSGPARPGTVPGANWVEYGFDQVYTIFDILLWNYNEDSLTPGGAPGSTTWSMQGMKEVTIQYTTVGNGGGWGSDDSNDWTTVSGGTITLDRGTGGNELTPEIIPMDAAAQWVVITAVTGAQANFMCDNLGGAFCTTSPSVEGALSEVRFTLEDPPAAPPALPDAEINPAVLADVTGLSFTSSSGVVYELERALKVVPNATIGSPAASNGWDTTSEVSLHTAVAGGFSAQHSAPRGAIHTINGNGIDSGPGNQSDLHNNTINNNMWLGNANGGNPRGGTVAGSNWIAYDLGTNRTVLGMHIWNYGEANFSEFGMNEVTIEYSSTGSTDTNDWSVYYDGAIPRASETVPSAAELAINNTVTGQYFVITSDNGSDGNHDGAGDPFIGQDGLSEVRFVEPKPGPPDINNSVFEGTGAFTVGDGGDQTLFDPNGWDPGNYFYRVVPQ